MELEIYLKCMVACLLGNVVHAAFKFQSLYTDYKKANAPYTFLQFLKDEKVVLVVNAIASFGLVYLIDELVLGSSYIANKVKILFFFVGLTGSYVALQIKSVGKDKLRAIVDRKTNIADAVTESRE